MLVPTDPVFVYSENYELTFGITLENRGAAAATISELDATLDHADLEFESKHPWDPTGKIIDPGDKLIQHFKFAPVVPITDPAFLEQCPVNLVLRYQRLHPPRLGYDDERSFSSPGWRRY